MLGIRRPINPAWVMLGVAFGSYFASSAVWGSFSVFMTALIDEFGWNRAAIALSVAISTFSSGLSTPIFGYLADRFGPKRVMLGGTLALGLALLGLSQASELWHFYVLFGLVVGASNTALSGAPVSTLVVRWFQRRRGMALGFTQAGFSVGQLLQIPLVTFIVVNQGWRWAFVALGIIILAWMPFVWFLGRDRPEEVGLRADGEREDAARTAPAATRPPQEPDVSLSCAARTAPFWLLVTTFGVCGFTVHMVMAHFATHAVDMGLSLSTAGTALSLMGGMNVAGTFLAGAISDRIGRKNPLALLYILRGLAILLLMNAHDPWSLYLAAAVIGFSFRATGPLTSGLCGDLFGIRSVGVIFGLVLMTHQLAGGVSAYAAGWAFDVTGSYTPVFLVGVALLVVAGVLSFLIPEVSRKAAPTPALGRADQGR